MSPSNELVTWARHLGPSLAAGCGLALFCWGSMRVVTTGLRRVVTTRLGQVYFWHPLAGAERCRDCSSLMSAFAASVELIDRCATVGWQRRQGCRLGQDGRLSCPMPDAYLHAFRRPGFRR
jgi:hypothetical protein